MIQIYNDDCNSIIDDFIKRDKKIDTVFTSPPYNRKRNDKYKNYDDTLDDYYGFLVNITEKLFNIINKYIIINVQTNYYNKQDVYRYIGKYYNKIQQIIIWEKSNPLPASGNNITNAYEYFIVLGNIPLKSNTTYTKNHITTSVNSETTTKIHKAVMKQDVSDWFIESCMKIKYMFPKAHAAAYVIAAIRLGWFKIYEPIAYYSVYFTVRGSDFDAVIVNSGKSEIRKNTVPLIVIFSFFIYIHNKMILDKIVGP